MDSKRCSSMYWATLATLSLLVGCGVSGKIVLKNPSESAVSCLTEIDGAQESFDTETGFTKETKNEGFIYISCQKQTANDTSTIEVEAYVNKDLVKTGTASAEFGIATASGMVSSD